eukprot:COSAG02_NODE_68_length_42582_cov_52.351129_45_plen_360_part_00
MLLDAQQLETYVRQGETVTAYLSSPATPDLPLIPPPCPPSAPYLWLAGWLVVDAPWPRELTAALRPAVEVATEDPVAVREAGGHKWTHHTLKPQLSGSYWTALDHSEDFMAVMLHPEVVELARQLEGTERVFFRNGGINQLRPGSAILWHHDYKRDVSALPEVPSAGVEFMHYFGGASKANGCLRIIPGSHALPDGRRYLNPSDPTRFDELLATHRPDADTSQQMTDGLLADVGLPGEVSIELTPDQLLVRSTAIYHASWANETAEGRLMHHWLYRPVVEGEPIDGEHCGNHRFHWEEYLTTQLIAALSPGQREVLMLDEKFEIDPVYYGEREKELGSVRWGTRKQLEAQFAGDEHACL